MKNLKEKSLISSDASDIFQQSFSGLTCDIIKNHFTIQDRNQNGFRHNEEVKKFAVSLHYFSPAAYEYVRSVFTLPCVRSISNWTSSVYCDPGFFMDVFDQNQLKIEEHPEY